MKYKVGDKVKIYRDINCSPYFKSILSILDYIITISKVYCFNKKINPIEYSSEEFGNSVRWYEDEIDDSYIEPVPIKTRWELLDL